MSPPERRGRTRLDTFNNDWYDPGAGVVVRVAWALVSGTFFQTWVPWPSRLKRWLLRLFGAKVGAGVVVKPRVNVKYPWHLSVGDHAWIGEGVWVDSLAPVRIGSHACLSQGAMVETGNHDWTKPTFDLRVEGVVIDDGAWAAARSLLLPGSTLASHAVLCAGSILSGFTEPFGVYMGVPARKVKNRTISPEDG